jgi:adenylate cyclase
LNAVLPLAGAQGAAPRAVRTLDGVLWHGHFPGFARATTTLSGAVAFERLTAGLDALSAAVDEAGGHVLQLRDDGLIALFPRAGDGDGAACRRALDALMRAERQIASILPQDEAKPLDLRVTLHLGTVRWAEITAGGRPGQLVLGADAGIAAALGPVCSFLRRRLVATASVATALQGALVPLGSFSLRGVVEPQQLFGLAGDGAPSAE